MFKFLTKIFAVLSLLMITAISMFGATAGKLTLTGSTTVLPIAQAAAEEYMGSVDKKLKITVNGGGSGNGISSLISSTTDICNSSRPIKDGEVKDAESKGVKPFATSIALDGIVVIIHSNVKGIDNITIDQLKKIYNGTIKNWKELGGSDGEIVIVSRDTSSGTFSSFTDMVLGSDKMRADAMMAASNQAVATQVVQTPNSIGYVGIGFVKSLKDTKALKVNGVEATEKTVIDKSYKLSRELYMYTNGAPKGDAKKFIDFVLSPKGQQIVAEQDYIKLPKKK